MTGARFPHGRAAPAGSGELVSAAHNWAQIGIMVEDVDAVHRKAAQFGVTVLEGPHDGEWGRNAVYESPGGNIVSITAA